MIEMIGEWLTRDVALWGKLYSPLLSWIGAGGLIAFVSWQAIRLCAGVRTARALCMEIDDTLSQLLKERRVTQRDPLTSHRTTVRTPPLNPNNSRDLDDLGTLDRLMGEDAAVFQAWSQYRKTLVLEPVAWFQEPRIFSTCHSEEFFTFERLFARRVHQAWYSHVPSFVTGVSLLLTFIALLVGLSHLHADEQGVQGLQGLINGLAGKFLTSIIGLICANLFSLIEKHVLYQLVTAHQDLVNSIECFFPRKTLEQRIEEQNAWHETMKQEKKALQPELEVSLHNLGLMIQDLTAAVKKQTLTLEIGAEETHGAHRPFEPRLRALSSASARS
jgi:hypothetical protein